MERLLVSLLVVELVVLSEAPKECERVGKWVSKTVDALVLSTAVMTEMMMAAKMDMMMAAAKVQL